MNFKLDENIGRRGVELLKSAGHDVLTVRDQGLQGADDEAIFKVCRAEGRARSGAGASAGNRGTLMVTAPRHVNAITRVPNLEPGTWNPELGTWNLERRKSLGLSLIELIVFIVVLGVAVAGVLAALNLATRASADPMIQKQALAIAEAVLEEAQLMPFTYCDPDDPQAETALSAAVGATGCTAAAAVEAIGPEGAAPYGPETRVSGTTPFDNVNDYHNYSMSGISNIEGAAISGLGDYKAEVSVAAQALGGIAASDAQLITVTVTWPATGTARFTALLQGYRVRYAPNALP